MQNIIIGISAFYHDSAAALVIDGEIISAAQEERFTRIKHDKNFPINAIKYLLKSAKINLDQVDNIVFYEKPFLTFERLLETYVANAHKGFRSFKAAMPIWLREKLFQKLLIKNELKKISKNFNIKKLLFSEHHLSHAASAYYLSPFSEATVLVVDGGLGVFSGPGVFLSLGQALGEGFYSPNTPTNQSHMKKEKYLLKAAKIQCVAVPKDCPFALTLFGKISEINTQITVP